MEAKIIKITQFTDKAGQIFRTFKLQHEWDFFWLSELTFNNYPGLFSISADAISFKEPFNQFFMFEKRKNKNGEFLVLIPKKSCNVPPFVNQYVKYEYDEAIHREKKEGKYEDTKEEYKGELPSAANRYLTIKHAEVKPKTVNKKENKEEEIIFSASAFDPNKTKFGNNPSRGLNAEGVSIQPRKPKPADAELFGTANTNDLVADDFGIPQEQEVVFSGKLDSNKLKGLLGNSKKDLKEEVVFSGKLDSNKLKGLLKNSKRHLRGQTTKQKPADAVLFGTTPLNADEFCVIEDQEEPEPLVNQQDVPNKMRKLIIPPRPIDIKQKISDSFNLIKKGPSIEDIAKNSIFGRAATKQDIVDEFGDEFANQVFTSPDDFTEQPNQQQTNNPDFNTNTDKGFSSNEKLSFIIGLLSLSSKRNVDDKTREKLFGLIGKELGKTGTVEEEILREVRELKQSLFDKNELQPKRQEIMQTEGNNVVLGEVKANKGKHRPKDVAEFMNLFEIRSAMKWLTHDFDDSEGEFDILVFLRNTKLVFDQFIKNNHFLPNSLYSIFNNFAFSPNPEWGEYPKINQGWSSKSWIEWCLQEKKHPMKNHEFYAVIQSFKKLTRMESPNLETVIKDVLRKALKEDTTKWEIDLIDCNKADFYTNTTFFTKALYLIFDGIYKRHSVSNQCTIKFSRETIGDFRKKTLSICHKKSFLTKPIDELEKEIIGNEKGDFNSIRNYLFGFCDWTIETSYDNSPIRIDILSEKNGVSVDFLDENVTIDGFTHNLIFYTK